MIAVVDYGAGNVRSICNMLQALNLHFYIAGTGESLNGAEKIILPGVGHFDHGMEQLETRGFLSVLNQMVIQEGIPLLGICLGAQLLARKSEEGIKPGLGWVPADVVKFDRSLFQEDLKVPHMGWAETWPAQDANFSGDLSEAFQEDARFYYVHSFHLLCDDSKHAILRSWYGYEFAAGVMLNNILGVQFHPEKSHEFGKRVLRAFSLWQPR